MNENVKLWEAESMDNTDGSMLHINVRIPTENTHFMKNNETRVGKQILVRHE